jgi:hypothetical protein
MHQLMQQPGRHDPDGHDIGYEPICGHEGQKLPEFIVGHVGHVPPTEIPPGIGHDPVRHDWYTPADGTGNAVLQGPREAPAEPPNSDGL